MWMGCGLVYVKAWRKDGEERFGRRKRLSKALCVEMSLEAELKRVLR